MSDPKKVVLESGRWTIQREDETPSEAMARLMRGEELDHERIPPETRRLMDAANQRVPRFKQ